MGLQHPDPQFKSGWRLFKSGLNNRTFLFLGICEINLVISNNGDFRILFSEDVIIGAVGIYLFFRVFPGISNATIN